MKSAILILMMSVVVFSSARAEDARSLQPAQAASSKPEHQPAGACTPIGLTANGDIVFPWECRETIEKQRGPIAVNLPRVSNDRAPHESAQDARKEDAVASVSTALPKGGEMVGPAAAPPDLSAASVQAKPRVPRKPVTGLGRSKLGQKGQKTALQSHQGSSGTASAKQDKVAMQPGATQK